VQTIGAKTTSTTGTCTPRMSSKDYSEGYVEADLFKPTTTSKTSRNQNKTYRDDYRYRDSKLIMIKIIRFLLFCVQYYIREILNFTLLFRLLFIGKCNVIIEKIDMSIPVNFS